MASKSKLIEQQMIAEAALRYRAMPDAEVYELGRKLRLLIPTGSFQNMPLRQPQRAFRWAVDTLMRPRPFADVSVGDSRWSQEDWDLLMRYRVRYVVPPEHSPCISNAILYQVTNLLRERLGPEAQQRIARGEQ